MTTLCVVSPGSLGVVGDRVQLSPKAVEGLIHYRASWPGPVVFVARPSASPQNTLGFDWPRMGELPVDVVVSHDLASALASLGSRRITLLPLEAENRGLVPLGMTVLVCDYPLRVRWEGARTDPNAHLPATIRTGLGLARRSPTLRSMVKTAAGLQCNGPDAFSTYGGQSRDALQYFDTRVTDAELVDAEVAHLDSRSGATLRLAFSGRWIHQKNPMAAVTLVSRLRAEGLDASLTMLGGGPLEPELRSQAGGAVDFRGRLDFHTAWVPTVRDQVDVMVLPHPQSDSASTYLEAISCGTPVIAYNNRYWRQFLALHEAGWTVPINDIDALFKVACRVANEPDSIELARSRGLEWARSHTFNQEFDRRMAHLRGIAQV